MIIAVTGHRPQKLGREWDGRGPVSDKIRAWLKLKLLELKPDSIITGMALGVDQIMAELAIELNIPFTAAIPCPGQDSRWPDRSKRRYADLLRKAAEVIHVSDKSYDDNPTCMQQRNEWMVDHCHVLLAVWDGSPGGTGNCVEYARRMQRTIVRFDPSK